MTLVTKGYGPVASSDPRVVFTAEGFHALFHDTRIGTDHIIYVGAEIPQSPKNGEYWINSYGELKIFAGSADFRPQWVDSANQDVKDYVTHLMDHVVKEHPMFATWNKTVPENISHCDEATAAEKYQAFEHAADLSGRLDVMQKGQEIMNKWDKEFDTLFNSEEGKKIIESVFIDNLMKGRVAYSTKRLDPPKYTAFVDPINP